MKWKVEVCNRQTFQRKVLEESQKSKTNCRALVTFRWFWLRRANFQKSLKFCKLFWTFGILSEILNRSLDFSNFSRKLKPSTVRAPKIQSCLQFCRDLSGLNEIPAKLIFSNRSFGSNFRNLSHIWIPVFVQHQKYDWTLAFELFEDYRQLSEEFPWNFHKIL